MSRALGISILAMALVACSDGGSGGDDDGTSVDAAVLAPDAAPASCGATTCATPPAAVCADAATLRVFLDDGACVDDACQFTTDEFACPYGCSAGACNAGACTPSCPSATCVPDGCGGMCGACASGATFPGFAPSLIGSAAEGIVLSADGVHGAVTRDLQALPSNCGWNPPKVGILDVYTFATSGQATRRIVGRKVPLWTVRFTGDVMTYMDDVDPCRGRGDLWVAHVDGSAPRRLATRVQLSTQLEGDTIFWRRPDPDDIDPSTYDGHVYAAPLMLGVPRQLAVDDYLTSVGASPDGSAVYTAGDAARTQIGRVSVHDVATGASRMLTPTTWASMYHGPWWAPDGDRLAFLHSTSGYAPWTLTIVNEDGTGRVDLSTAAVARYELPFSPDGRRVMFIERVASGAQDIVIRDLVAGTSARLSGVVPAASDYIVWRHGFSRDLTSVYAIVGPPSGTDTRPVRLLRGPAAGGTPTTLLDPIGEDGQAFATVVQEAPTGQIAVTGVDGTKVVTLAGAVTTIAGVPYEPPTFDPSGQKLLVEATRTSLRVFPASGAGSGTALASYRSTSDLHSAAFAREFPFVVGWWGSLALYPSNPSGSFYTRVVQDLRGWDETRSGVLAGQTYRYALAGDRLVFLTTDGALFAGRRP